jgi:DNA gyrase subunit B
MVELLIKKGVGDKQFLQDENRMASLRDLLIQSAYEVDDLNWNEERDVFELLVKDKHDELEKELIGSKTFVPVKIGRGLIYSSDFQKALLTGNNIKKYDLPPFNIFSTEKDQLTDTASNKYELMKVLLKQAKKGISIQRYKGLGEMNPDQLWETTMNPDKRTLLQVMVEDMVDTDEIFTILMGEEVEPRRDFIQSNALEVNTLDI